MSQRASVQGRASALDGYGLNEPALVDLRIRTIQILYFCKTNIGSTTEQSQIRPDPAPLASLLLCTLFS